MADTEPCTECGVLDALARHDPMCGYAIRIGLPRLAEGEQPIEPGAEDDALPEAAPEEATMIHSAAEYDEQFSDQPGAIQPTPHFATGGPAYRASDLTELWFSYRIVDVTEFDATVFESELDALRHAVATGEKVRRLELGRSLRKQTEDAP